MDNFMAFRVLWTCFVFVCLMLVQSVFVSGQVIPDCEPSNAFRADFEVEVRRSNSTLNNGAEIAGYYSGEIWQTEEALGFVTKYLSSPKGGEEYMRTYHVVRTDELVYTAVMPGEKIGAGQQPVNLVAERVAGKKAGVFFSGIVPSNDFEFVPTGLVGGLCLKDLFADHEFERDKSGTIHIVGSSELGSFDAFLDEREGTQYLRKVIINWSGKQVHRGIAVSSIDMLGGDVWPSGGVNKIRLAVECQEYVNLGREKVLSKWEALHEWFCSDKSVVKFHSIGALSNVRQAESKPKTQELFFGDPIPIGTRVNVDEGNFNYVWNGEWAVPEIDPIDGLVESGSSRYTTFIAGFLGILAIVLVLWFTKKGLAKNEAPYKSGR